MKKFLFVMAAAALMLAGCKAKTEKVAEQTDQQAVEQCCGNCAGEAQDDVCYIDENGEVHCTGGAEEHKCCHHDGKCDQKCCDKCDQNCTDKCNGTCKDKKCEGNCEGNCEHKCCGGENPQGCEAAAPAKGQCIQCGKCLPCPMDINIPVVIELVKKAKAAGKVSPELQKQYDALKVHASECIECGACENKCPNDVKVIETMKEAVKLFGK